MKKRRRRVENGVAMSFKAAEAARNPRHAQPANGNSSRQGVGDHRMLVSEGE